MATVLFLDSGGDDLEESGVQAAIKSDSHATAITSSASSPSPHSILARLQWQFTHRPNAIAILDEVNELTFSDLDQRSNDLAVVLKSHRIGTEDCVALLFERSVDFVVAALAVWKCGAAYLPLDPSAPADRGKFILGDAGAKILLSHRSKANGWVGSWKTLDIDQSPIQRAETSPLFVEIDDFSLAYIIYTSGSTGTPKGVEVTHGNLLNLIDWHLGAFRVTAEDRASQVAGFGFDAAVWEIWPHLAAGATLHIASEEIRRSPQTLRDWLVSQRISIAFVPTVLAEPLSQCVWPQDTSLRTMLTGADVLHRRPIAGLPFTFVNNYGPSECAVVATSGVVTPAQSEALASGLPSIGKPIRNTTVMILDEQLRPVPNGEAGELCLAGALVGRGYRNQPELTTSRFVSIKNESGGVTRIYRTGDRAKLLPNGEISFLGRLDQQIKIRGYRIEPSEIVAWLDRYQGIEASAIKVVTDENGASLVAYVVTLNDKPVTSKELRDYLATKLPDYMTPTSFVRLASLPVTANGKLDRDALPLPTPENALPKGSLDAVSGAAVVAKDNGADVASKLAGIVASLLKQPSVGMEDNFFLLGGHSMMGVQLVAKIRETFGVKLPLRQLFSTPTVAQLSQEISRQLR